MEVMLENGAKTGGVRIRIPTAVLAVAISLSVGAAINDYVAKNALLKQVVMDQRQDAAAIKDISETNKALLKEMKAVRIGLAKSGVMVEVDP